MSSVLIPGASAPAGINTIKSLKLANFSGKIISTDSNPLSAGFFLCDVGELLPEINNALYKKKLLNIIKKHKVKVLFPSSGFDIYPYSEHLKEISEYGATAVVSKRDVLEICRDKLLTFKNLPKSSKFVFTTPDPNEISGFPLFAKPRYGKGSKNSIKIENDLDLSYVVKKYNDMIFQEYLPGTEYTIDVLSDLSGNPLVAIPRIRLQTRGGISTIGRIIHNRKIEKICLNTAKILGVIGPCCIQMKEDKDGQLKIIEVNPRMGGGTVFTTLAGVNFPKIILDMVDGQEIVIPKVKEITIVRYFEELIVKN